MSSSESTASSRSSVEELASTSAGRRRRVSSRGSDIYRQDKGQTPWQDSENATRPLEDVEAGLSRRPRNASASAQAWADPFRNNSPSMDQDWAGQRPSIQTNTDRKRRLTNSAHNSGRVRTVSGGFHTPNQSSQGSPLGGSPSRNFPQGQRHGPSPYTSVMANATEPASRVLPPLRRQSSNMQRPMSTTREIILPKWQPDSEVSECPICSRQFTFWFRKHHCRKCGRVVCASCSPHRITIPRQFIVHPPESTNRTSTLPTSNPVVIDLTGETGSPPRQDSRKPWTDPRRTSNSSLGGGEEVRLCNPCVPDPQPNPQATMDLAEFLRQGPRRDEIGGPMNQAHSSHSSRINPGQSNPFGPHSPSDEARELRRQRGRGMIVRASRIRSAKRLTYCHSFSPTVAI
jgi:FYVE zinc finger